MLGCFMIVARTNANRTAPRQAIVALFGPSPRWPALALPLALDVVAAMCAANGFSVALAGSLAATKEIAPELPAGVDLRAHLPGSSEPPAVFFAREYAERGFERIILLAADTLGVSTRLISTTSSILGFDRLAVGQTPGERLYLSGVTGAAVIAGDDDVMAALGAFDSGPAPALPNVRRLERLPRLGEFVDRAELVQAIARFAPLLPRTRAQADDGF